MTTNTNSFIETKLRQHDSKLDSIDEKLESLEGKINLLPTKDEFFTKMDEVIGELKKSREEHTAQAGMLSNHEDRLNSLEDLHPEIQSTPI